MGAPLPWQSPTSLSFNSSTIFPPYHRTQTHRICTTSSSPSLYFCCYCNGTINNSRKRAREKSSEPIIEIKSEKDDLPNGVYRTEKIIKRDPSMKSLFGKRALWRRIFLASKKMRSVILLNVITVVYASNIPVVKEVEAIMDPGTFTVVRFASSAIPFIPFVLQARDDVQTRNAGIELGFWVSLGYLMQALGMLTSDAGRASFISMFTVVVVPLLDGLLGTIIPARTWFGALMSILGVAMLESSGSPPCIGDLLNFLSAVFFGVHMLRTEHISRSTMRENFLPLLGYEVCVVALLSTIWYLVGGWFGGLQDLNPSSWTWAAFWDSIVTFPWIPALYTGIFSTGLCLWIEMSAMRDVSATETAIIYGLEAFWGAGFAWFLLGERWGFSGWIGATLVLAGSLTVQIYGATSTTSSAEVKGSLREGDGLLIPDKKIGLAKSPIVVSSREDSSNLLDKRSTRQ